MGVLEDTVVKAKEVIDIAGKKADEVISMQKLKVSAARLHAQISKDYEALGRVVYHAKTSEADDAGVAELLSALKEKHDQLNEIELKIAAAKGAVVCTSCRAVNSADAMYCSKCGHKLESCFESGDASDPSADESAAEESASDASAAESAADADAPQGEE